MLSYLSSLLISVLRNLDNEANKFYDRTNRLYDTALLTRCYYQHAIRQVIDSKINHIRYLIKIRFINGGGRVVRWCWVNFQSRGVLQFGLQ